MNSPVKTSANQSDCAYQSHKNVIFIFSCIGYTPGALKIASKLAACFRQIFFQYKKEKLKLNTSKKKRRTPPPLRGDSRTTLKPPGPKFNPQNIPMPNL